MTDPEADLSLTVRELSNSYEELSLLYRISNVFSSFSTDEICRNIIEEAVRTIGAKTAAILLLDEGGERLYTKISAGAWDPGLEFPRDKGVLWRSILSRKTFTVCSLAETEYVDYLPELSSLMVCPLIGKLKVTGALLVADKGDGEEFYSHDCKLLGAIAVQAGLAIENATLYGELESLLIGAIKSLVKALEATSCWTAGHTERVTEYSVAIGESMGLEKEMLERIRICALLHDIGKIATPKEILNKKGQLSHHERREIQRHPGLGAEILVELKQFKDIIASIKYHHEHWDGMDGIFGLKGTDIPLIARILSVADAFDAMTSDRPYRRMKSRNKAVEEIVKCSGTQFDPEVVNAFLKWVNGFNLQRRNCEA